MRKTTGTVTGFERLNQLPADATRIGNVAGYVEQEDALSQEATVMESLQFSADLRLDPSLPQGEKAAFLRDIVRMLELEKLTTRRIDTLSRGELKRVALGVELAGNPPILFTDEPTSGLTTREAALVVEVLRRVASTGRTCVATIHQPAPAVFFGFSHLLLLAPGGHQVYFGG